MTTRDLERTIEFWRENGYPDSITESQRKYNAKAFESSMTRLNKMISDLNQQGEQR